VSEKQRRAPTEFMNFIKKKKKKKPPTNEKGQICEAQASSAAP
jgi:hypothetical protein